MCGICGTFSPLKATTDPKIVEQMNHALKHRGPDGQGIHLEKNLCLGHRRLSIIDLEGGKQPMQSPTKKTLIAFNGEIYNYPILRKELLKKGYPFQTKSDTEVVLALYETYGSAAINKLSGMFAFALWDREQQCLILARDRSGMKPLYYAENNGSFFFASEIKAIRLALPQFSEINPEAVNFYFSRQYIGGYSTIFKHIKKVKPGSFLKIDASGIQEKVYWRLTPAPPDPISPEEAFQKTDMLLHQAVKSHLVSDVPVGVFLSGGLDSGTLLAYAVEHSTEPIQTFSVGFGENSALNETHHARFLSSHFNTRHHEVHVTEEEVLDCLPHIITHMDQPLADYALLPTYIMSRFAAEQVKVVLSGEGADELFGGYKRYQLYAILDQLGPLAYPLKNLLPSPSVFKTGIRKKIIHPDYFIEDKLLPAEQKIAADKSCFSSSGHLNSMLYTDMNNWLVDDLLMKVDKMGMLASLEARIPYLDHHLIEYIFRLGGKHKVGWKTNKRILRKIASKKLPPEIFSRQKHGFTVPVGAWFRKGLKASFENVVFDNPSAREWLNIETVQKMFDAHLNGKNYRLQLWSIYVFCLWHKKHIA